MMEWDEDDELGGAGALPAAHTGAPELYARPELIDAHLRRLAPKTAATLIRENDWLAAPVVLRLRKRAMRAERLEAVEVDDCVDRLDQTWSDAPAWVAYGLGGRRWVWRTVVRRDGEGSLVVTPPAEVRTGDPPSPGSGLAAEPPQSGESGVVTLRSHPTSDSAADDAYATLMGGDFRLRTLRGQRINNTGLLGVLLPRLIRAQPQVATVGVDHRLYAATCRSTTLGTRAPAIGVEFVGGQRPLVERGHVIHVTSLLEGRLYTFRLVATRFEGTAAVCAEPKEVFAYERRAAPRYEIRLPGLAGAAIDESGNVAPLVGLRDLSVGGAGLLLAPDAPLKRGRAVRLVLQLSERHTLELHGVVMSADRQADGLRVGVRFGELEPKQGILIERLIQKTGRLVL